MTSASIQPLGHLVPGALCLAVLHATALEAQEATQPPASDSARAAATQAFDPGGPPKTRRRLTSFLSMGARLRIESEYAHNLDLDRSAPDDISTVQPQLSVAFALEPHSHLRAFVNADLSERFTFEARSRQPVRRTEVEVPFAYLHLGAPAKGLSLRVGRQRFRDSREWLFDEKLDAVRLRLQGTRAAFEVSASRDELLPKELAHGERGDPVNYYLAYAQFSPARKLELGAYGLLRDDRTADEESPIWLGLRAIGEFLDGLEGWIELAAMRGHDGSDAIRAYAVDVGGTLELHHRSRASVTLGYAFGTGDADPDDDVDRSFHQTDFEDNSDKFNGVARLKYYGELLDPELSNLHVFTAGVGIRPTRRSSIDLVAHHYRLHQPVDGLPDVEIEASTAGTSRRVADELDLVAGFRGITNVDMKLVLGYLRPLDAFPSGATHGVLATLQLQYSF